MTDLIKPIRDALTQMRDDGDENDRAVAGYALAKLDELERSQPVVCPLCNGSKKVKYGISMIVCDQCHGEGVCHDLVEIAPRTPSHAAADAPTQLKPCRSPYCECTPGQCTHPGCYDARHESFPPNV